MEASRILTATKADAPALAGRRPVLRYEDERLFAADPRSCGQSFADPVLRLVRCDASTLRRRLCGAACEALLDTDGAAKQRGLARGDVLFAIVDPAGRLLHHSFVQFAAPVLGLLGEARSVPLIGRCATLAAARGQRLYPRTLRHILAELAAAGHARVAIYCDSDNHASIQGIRHAGFVEIARLKTLLVSERWAVQWRRPGGIRLISV